jgi:hypothetical protein
MPKLLVVGLAFASLACLCNTAPAKTVTIGAISAKDLRTDCDVLGGKFGELTDSKSGAHYYWCKTSAGTTKCVDNKCTMTTRMPTNDVITGTGAGNTRNPGAAGSATPTAGSPKVGAMTGGPNSKQPIAPAAGVSPTATTVGVARPVMVPGPVSNNNKRQQQ